MPRKPNYRHDRMERERAKDAKKAEKLKKQQERKAQRDGEPETGDATADDVAPASDDDGGPRA